MKESKLSYSNPKTNVDRAFTCIQILLKIAVHRPTMAVWLGIISDWRHVRIRTILHFSSITSYKYVSYIYISPSPLYQKRKIVYSQFCPDVPMYMKDKNKNPIKLAIGPCLSYISYSLILLCSIIPSHGYHF